MSELTKRDGSVSKHTPVRKLEFSLEDQIYKILRKAKVVSNVRWVNASQFSLLFRYFEPQ